MLLPALNKAREKGRMIYCINNMKQFGYGIAMYSDSFDAYAMPCIFGTSNQYSWIDYLHNENEMNEKIFKRPCVLDSETFNPYGGSALPSCVSKASYSMNVIAKGAWNGAAISTDPAISTGWGDNSSNPVSIKKIQNPERKIYIVDSLKYNTLYLGWVNSATRSSDATRIISYLETDHGTLPIDSGADRRDVGNHHSIGFNSLMGDMHAELIKESDPDQWVVSY